MLEQDYANSDYGICFHVRTDYANGSFLEGDTFGKEL